MRGRCNRTGGKALWKLRGWAAPHLCRRRATQTFLVFSFPILGVGSSCSPFLTNAKRTPQVPLLSPKHKAFFQKWRVGTDRCIHSVICLLGTYYAQGSKVLEDSSCEEKCLVSRGRSWYTNSCSRMEMLPCQSRRTHHVLVCARVHVCTLQKQRYSGSDLRKAC